MIPLIKDVVRIQPMECKTVDGSRTICVDRVVELEVTFKDDNKNSVTKVLSFLVVKNSTEDLMLGYPTLCSMGFVSDEHTIELRAEDLRFNTVIPDVVPDAKEDHFLFFDEP